MATSSAEAKRMIDAAKKADRLLMVNQCQRLAQANRKAKEILDSGIMGRVLYVNAMFGHEGPIAWSADAKWFLRKKDASFGAMADLGVHKADLLRHLLGKEIVEVSAFSENIDTKRSDVEDNFAACIKFEDGTIGTLGASWTARGLGTDHVILHCERGTLRVQLWEGKPCVAHLCDPECEINFELPEPFNDYPESWGMDAGGKFAKACLGIEEPFCTAEDGKKSLEVILACQQAAKSGKRVKL
jgi:predicted dehydrogenase